MWHFVYEPLGLRLTWVLLHFVWQGAVVAVLAAAAWQALRAASPASRYVVGLLAVAGMAICPLATFVALGPVSVVASKSEANTSAPGSAADATSTSPNRDAGDAPSGAIPPAFTARPMYDVLRGAQPYLLLSWLCGVCAMSARLLTGIAGTIWLRGSRTSLPLRFAGSLARVGRQLGVKAWGRVFASERVSGALAVGFWRPIVLVPTAWLAELPVETLEAIVAHELAHIRRWDLWATLAQRIVETLLFFHPAVWWLSRRVTLEREMCCDDAAVAAATGGRAAYARALELVGRQSQGGVSFVLATSFGGEQNMNLLKRVRNVLGLRPDAESRRSWPAGVAILTVALLAALLGMDSRSRVLADDPPREGGRTAPREGATDMPTNFQPQTQREAALFQIIVQMQQEIAQLRSEVQQMRGTKTAPRTAESTKRGPREGDSPRTGPREGDTPRTGPRDGEAPKSGPRDGEKPRTGPRDGDVPRTGPRDGEVPKTGPRDGDVPRTGPRDGETPKSGPRDGDAPSTGPRDGEKPRAPAREG